MEGEKGRRGEGEKGRRGEGEKESGERGEEGYVCTGLCGLRDSLNLRIHCTSEWSSPPRQLVDSLFASLESLRPLFFSAFLSPLSPLLPPLSSLLPRILEKLKLELVLVFPRCLKPSWQPMPNRSPHVGTPQKLI